MVEKKEKKKKLTLSVSTSKPYSPSFRQTGKKKSVIIEKKPQRRGTERRFSDKNENINKIKTKTSDFKTKNFIDKRNFEIRKLAEERATKRFKHEEGLQSKKINQGKSKGSQPKREYKLTISKALDDEALETKGRSLASIKRAAQDGVPELN